MSYTPDCADCPTPDECKAANNCQVTQQIRHGRERKAPEAQAKSLATRMAEALSEMLGILQRLDINSSEFRKLIAEFDRRGGAKQLMDDPRARFNKLTADATFIAVCRFCGRGAELWEVVGGTGSVMKAVMCSNNDDEDECPFYLPPNSYYYPTRREAINHWNNKHRPA